MPRSFLLIALLFLCCQAPAQTTIWGMVRNEHQEPLAGASITIENSYDGSTSALDGSFSFTTMEAAQKKLIVTILGYKNFEQVITITAPSVSVNPVLQEQATELKTVTISAGTFEASEKKRSTILKPLDIITTAGAQADIVGALKTLPGTQQVGESDGLFVRGGTGAETKVFIDGMTINNPFYSSVPDLGQRARFSPLLFKGTVFSTGGYSAQFGEALSSALILETRDLPSRTESNFLVSSPQLSATEQKLSKSKNQSIGVTVNYSNLSPYFKVVPQRIDYEKPYESLNGDLNARKKIGPNGMLKFYGYANYNTVALNRPSLDHPGSRNYFSIYNNNVLAIATYQDKLSSAWKLYTGMSYSYNKDQIQTSITNTDSSFNKFSPVIENRTIQARGVLTNNLKGLSKLNIGAECQLSLDQIFAKDTIPHIRNRDGLISPFIETDIYITQKFVSRVGLRYEYSSLLKKSNLGTRISIAYKLKDNSQVSFAYGDFYQKPESRYLFRNTHLDFSSAAHYILNYQKIKNEKTLRIELFYKNYKNLLVVEKNDPSLLKSSGDGYAKGIDVFWRDRTSIKGLDYWISYSYLDTKRKFLDYPKSVQPNFAANHTASLVVKRFVRQVSTSFGLTYTYASGRPYFNPNRPPAQYMMDKTMDFRSVGFAANYLTMIGKANAVIMLNVSNLFGNYQVYGYNYSSARNSEGIYDSAPIMPSSKRFVFLAIYLSLGVDRRQQIIDN